VQPGEGRGELAVTVDVVGCAAVVPFVQLHAQSPNERELQVAEAAELPGLVTLPRKSSLQLLLFEEGLRHASHLEIGTGS
jgi:hypothetical protein